MKKLLTVIIALSLVSLTACQSAEIPTIKAKPESNTTAPVAESQVPVTNNSSTGDATETEAGMVTVKKVEVVKPGEYDTIKKGNEIILVTLEIVNNQEKQIDYNPYNFQMVNSKGQVSDSAISVISNNDTALGSGKLEPQGIVEGTIAYEQPKGEQNLKLAVKKNMFSDEAVYIDLESK